MQKKEILEKRGAALKAMDAVWEAAEKETRQMTDDECIKYDTFQAEIEGYDRQLERIAKRERRNVTDIKINHGGEDGERKNIAKRYSIISAVNQQMRGRFDGLVKEMHETSVTEAREFGKEIEGVGIPAFLFSPAQKRDLTVGTSGQIGNTVATDVGDLIPYLQPRLKVMELGATMLPNLTSNLTLPRNNAIGAAVWEGETDDNAETNLTTDTVSLSPKRLGAFQEYSKQLFLQSSVGVDALVRKDLENAIAIALDKAAINGSGSSNQPYGILNTTGIGSVAMGTNGAVPTHAKLVDLETAIATANADMGSLAFLTTPGIRGKLKQTLLDAGSGLFVWGSGSELLGYNAQVSTQVPSDLTKNTSVGVCHAIIFGNWEDLLVAQWGGLDLLADPYTQGIKAMVRIVVNSWWDIAARHPESFAAIKDALTA